MATTVEELLIKLDADLSGLRSEMELARKKVEKEAAKTESRLQKMGKSLGDLTVKAAKWGAAMAAAAAVAGVALARAGANMADDLGDMADRLDISVDRLQALSNAAAMGGVNLEGLSVAVREMNRTIAQAAAGSGAAVGALDRLGLSAESLSQLTTDEAFLRVTDALAAVESHAVKTELSMQILGRGGAQLINQMGGMAEATREQEKRLKALGIEMGRIDVEKAAQGADAFDRFGQLASGAMMKFGATLGPVFNAFELMLERSIIKAGGVGVVINKVRDVVFTAVELMGDAWQGFGIVIDAITAGAAALELNFWIHAKAIVTAGAWIANKLSAAWEVVRSGFVVTGNAIKLGWEVISGVAKETVAAIIGQIGSLMQNIGQSVMNLRNIAGGPDFKAIGGSLLEAGVTLNGAANKMSSAAMNGVREAAEDLEFAAETYSNAKAELFSAKKIETPFIDEQMAEASDRIKNNIGEIVTAVKSIREQGSMGEAWRAELEGIVAGLDAEAEARALAREKELAERDKANEAKLLQEMEFAAKVSEIKQQMEQEERDALARNTALLESGLKGRLTFTAGILKNLSALQDSHSRKAFEVGKAAATADAIVQTYLGATRALATVPYPFNFVAAASVVAAGIANVQKIQRQRFGGGASGAGGGGSAAGPAEAPAETSSSAGAAPSKTTSVNVSLVGERFSANQVRGLIDSISDQLDDNAPLRISRS